MRKTERKTAKIYAFPVGGAAPRKGRFKGDGAARRGASAGLPTTEFGSGWYHDAAINDPKND